MWECNSVNKVVLTYINALVGFLLKIVIFRYTLSRNESNAKGSHKDSWRMDNENLNLM
jgi:hypothetical protein